ncbi:reverse transcriptase [Senna tora]|uniref:Reverse transcriptase n=1 Tax=Senna tora TaxID=362788 RepID=A0A834XC78_9FABA|nr:reverse transcriptase [Senna tora]
MANTHMLREASWSESQNTPQYSSSSSSGYSTEDSGDLEPDFIIPRQGPVLEFSAPYINMQRDFWRNCLIGVLVDDNMVKASRLQNIINRVLNLQHLVRVVGRSKNVFAFEFGCDLDKEIIHHEVCVEFWGFPLEYYTFDIAELVGSMVGTVLQVDFSDQGFRNLRYLRVKVEVDRSLPLLMGFYVLLDDDRTIWIQCRYERMFRICRQCGCIVHVAKDCKKTRRRAQAAIEAQKEALRQRFDTVSFMDLESPLFVNEAMAFRKFKGRRTTKIRVQVEQNSIVYHTHEFRPICFTRTRSSSSSSSSSPGTNVYRVFEDSSSGAEGSSSYSSPPSQSEHVNVVDDQMEDEEDPLTQEGYYSDPFGQGSQGGVASNPPHLTNVNDPLTPQSPINWDLIAAEITHWQPTSEGAPVPTEGGPQEQLLHQVNPNLVQNTYSVDAEAQVQVEYEDISNHRVHMQNQDVADADASSSLFPHASGLDVPPHVWSELIQSLFTLGLNQEAHFNPFLLWPTSTLTIKAQCLLARWISGFLPMTHWASLRNTNHTCSVSSPPSLKRRLLFSDASVIKRLRSQDVARPKTFHRITFTEPTGPALVFIAETLLSFDNASSLLHKWGFERSCGTSVEGKKGGTILAWKGSVQCQVLDISPHWIHAFVVDGAGIEFNLTCVYGPPHLSARPPFWQKLTSFSQETQLPWLLLGDFNQVLCQSEKLSVNCKIPGVEDFENFLHDACLVNLHPQGNWFTWTNGRVGEGAVWERLDRALCNVAWLNVYPQTSVFCLPIYTSDHSPFVVLLHDVVPRRPRPSRFEAMWLLDDSCKQVVSHAWNINISGSSAYLFVSKCRNVMSQLKRWNREVLGHIPSKLSDLQRHIKVVQEQVGESVQDDTLLAIEAALRNELEKLLDKEEILWAQKSRQMWLLQGDRNTKYFHTLVKKRRINNRISRIKLDSGEWTQSYSAMEGTVLDYFSHVYSMDHDAPEEVESALFKMKSDKAPGPDGLPPLVITPYQNGFVKGRSISDNVFLASEIMSYIHKARRLKTSWCAFKIDIHKAYDKLSWNFLEAVLLQMHFPRQIIQIIMQCVRTVSYSLLLNGQLAGSFFLQRGIQQGDPMCSYLFLLCANVLSCSLLKSEQQKQLTGIKFARRGPAISHLMYADDTILFFRADDLNCSSVKQAIDMYATLAGQQLNYDKPFLVFSPNTSRTVKDRIASQLGVAVSNKIGRYMGSFVDNKLSDPQNYNVLIERIGSKLAGWKAKTLSQAGRLTLIKSVLQPLNIYHMSTLTIPRKYCHQMDAVCSNFFWGFRGGKSAMHLLNKRKIFAPRDRGGLGLRYAELVNVALVTKQRQSKGVYRTLTRQELHIKNCLFLLKRKKKHAELLQQLFDLECIMPQYVFSGPGPYSLSL